jgi:hypothetical protein
MTAGIIAKFGKATCARQMAGGKGIDERLGE